MSQVVINDNHLLDIANAIREKSGSTDTYKVGEMADAIADLSVLDAEPLVLTGDCQYACGGQVASKCIELFGDTISTEDITNTSNMFKNYLLETIPFEINMKNGTEINMSNMFHSSINLIELPKINNV